MICSRANAMLRMRLQNASVLKSAHKGHGIQMLHAIWRWRGCGGAAHPGAAVADIVLINHLPDPNAGKAPVHPIGVCRVKSRSAPGDSATCEASHAKSCQVQCPHKGTCWTYAFDSVTALRATSL